MKQPAERQTAPWLLGMVRAHDAKVHGITGIPDELRKDAEKMSIGEGRPLVQLYRDDVERVAGAVRDVLLALRPGSLDWARLAEVRDTLDGVLRDDGEVVATLEKPSQEFAEKWVLGPAERAGLWAREAPGPGSVVGDLRLRGAHFTGFRATHRREKDGELVRYVGLVKVWNGSLRVTISDKGSTTLGDYDVCALFCDRDERWTAVPVREWVSDFVMIR